MTLRTLVASALVLLLGTTAAVAQQQTGEIYGKAADNSGAVLPGATVTVAGPALIQPRVAITSETGTYRVPELPIGTYSVTFELAGFRSLALQDIRVTIGFRAQVNGALELSTVQETVTVTGASPLVDTRETGTSSTFDLETMQNIPSARDPWVMLEKTPGITMDRVNVGGNQSGQQSGYISRGSSTGNNKWSIDGVDITDMAATGASPIYYDFDMLEEMQVTTGGADVTQQTGGVGINLVTKSGTDRFKGNGRALITDEKFSDDNITPELKAQGAGSGAPIQNIRDFGFDVGGPIMKGKLWYWGSYGAQDIKVGVVGFYEKTPECTGLNSRTAETELIRSCLSTDLTQLHNYNWKLSYVPFANNRLNFQNTWAEKVRNARDASDTRPIETTYRQKAVSSDFGTFGWLTGPSPFWKVGDQHVVNDRWLVDVMWAHLGNNFVLDFHEDDLRDVQARQETTTGLWGRSYQASTFLRPTNSLDVVSSYFLPATMGGDHSLKFGYRWRSAHSTSLNHHGAFVDARFTNGVPNSADIWRDQNSESHLNTNAFYLQDTFTKNRFTLNIGFRYDMQDDAALAARVPENPFFPQLMPAIDFKGADAGVTWKDFSPRVGFTYDLKGDGRNVFSSSYATYYGQMGPGQLSSQLAATGAVFVRYPWVDTNGDTFVQASEVNTTGTFLSKSTAYDPANPTSTTSPTRVDPNVKNDQTREFIVGFDRQMGSVMAVGASYVWRKYDQFLWNDRDNWTTRQLPIGRLPGNDLPGWRALRADHLLRADECAAVGERLHEPPGSLPGFQRPRADLPEAHGEPLVGERELRLQQRDRTLRLAGRPGGSDMRHRRLPGFVPVRPGIGRQRHRQRVRELEVAVQGHRPRHAAVGNQRRWRPQRAPGLSLPAVDPDPEPRQRRRPGASPARSARRGPPRQLDDDRSARRQGVPPRKRHAHPGHGHLQPDQQQHGAGHQPPAGGDQRQHGQRHHRAARRPLRRQRSLVSTAL